MAQKRIKLQNLYKGHKGNVEAIVLREPLYADIQAVGSDPLARIHMPGGAFTITINREAVGQYLDRLVEDMDQASVIPVLKLIDAMAVEDAICSFFEEARSLFRSGSPLSSSLTPEMTPEQSAE